jgi:hypothetical protein
MLNVRMTQLRTMTRGIQHACEKRKMQAEYLLETSRGKYNLGDLRLNWSITPNSNDVNM